jgi:O-antigen ligase
VPRWGRASDFFFHEQFTDGLFAVHPTYYSLLGCLATLFAFQIARSWQRVIIIIIISFFLILIDARITIIIQSLLVISFLIMELSKGFTIKKLAFALIIPLFIFVLIKVNSVYDYPHRKMLVNLEATWERSFASDISDGDGGLVVRFAIWRSALDVIQRKTFFGVGLGREKEALNEEYRKKNVPFLIQNSLDAHNQMLSYLIAIGVLGLALVSVFCFFLVKEAYLKKCWPYLTFFAIFLIVGLTESVFNRGLGTAIFAFFNSLLALKYMNDDE